MRKVNNRGQEQFGEGQEEAEICPHRPPPQLLGSRAGPLVSSSVKWEQEIPPSVAGRVKQHHPPQPATVLPARARHACLSLATLPPTLDTLCRQHPGEPPPLPQPRPSETVQPAGALGAASAGPALWLGKLRHSAAAGPGRGSSRPSLGRRGVRVFAAHLSCWRLAPCVRGSKSPSVFSNKRK